MTASEEDEHSRSGSPEDSGVDQSNEDSMQYQGNGANKRENAGSITNSKDPSRPRRKKARRACYACQRAHLTCGDERPCQRCIKRGLQDACQDGVRKKAKYLHDAPNEALMPGAGGNSFSHSISKDNGLNTSTEAQSHPQAQQQFYSQDYNVFSPTPQMPPPLSQERNMSSTTFPQQSPVGGNFNIGPQGPLQSPTPGDQHSNTSNMNTQGWNQPIFDDQSMFNFDVASMNFGNHYGALEFGMLGQIAANAGETPTSDTANQRDSMSHQYRIPFGSLSESPTQQMSYADTIMSDWSNGSGVYNAQLQNQSTGPHSYAIETNVAQFASPDGNTALDPLKLEDSPMMTSSPQKTFPEINRPNQPVNEVPQIPVRRPTTISTPQLKAKSQLPKKSSKRLSDPSSIYTTVKYPHPYTAGFHALIAYLQRRFATSPSKTLAIAKSLASIRPSFIATTKTLNREDLIFMEKCFQRTLWEYEGFIEGVGTPTIVARRTGEVAAVGKEFLLLTGWDKDVLLGHSPNLNVNRGHSGSTPNIPGSGANTTGKVTGWNTPTQKQPNIDPETGEKRLQPVFLAELLDDDSIVQFYEDFARLSFGDSRGSVMGKGKLLKYRTKDDEIAKNLQLEVESRDGANIRSDTKKFDSYPNKRQVELKREGISGERGMQKLGSADGKVDCTYCWTVKRDVFDIPMLIIMNFLPCI